MGLKPQYPLKKSTKSPTFDGPYPYSGIKTPVPLHACVILKGMGRENQGIVWVVAGPTASGKSDFALGQAEKRGEIINCDSRKLYQGLPLLTAQPSALTLKAVPYHLYGVCSPQYNSVSAGQWQKWAVGKK